MGSPADASHESDAALMANIVATARIDDAGSILRMLAQADVRAADLIAASESRAEAMLQQAGLPAADALKILRELRRFHATPAPAARGGGSCRGSCSFFLLRAALALTPCCGVVRRKASSFVPASARPKPTMKCGLVVYSATVMMIAFTVLSFYLPAMLYHARLSTPRIGGHYLQPTQAHFAMPMPFRDVLPLGSLGKQGSHGRQVMMVTANQPLPCTTRRGDWIMQLAVRNKLMYATLHGYKTWWSTELVSAWDLEAAWNKIPLLYVLMHPESPVTQGIEWMLWMDDDAIFTDMNFTFPFDDYDASGINLVIWGDPQRVFRGNDVQGLNTGVFLLRKCEWSRQLMAEVAALATPSIRRQVGNQGKIAEQGALTWVLHSQTGKWKDRVLLERNFTMNGNWMDYYGKWTKGARSLAAPVWGDSRIPFVVQYAGCQMCRGHSENGSWHDHGVKKCHSAFLEAYTFADDQVLNAIGLRHLSMETHLVRANPGSELYQRHQRMTRCLPSFLVIGTQKGGTSSFHWLLKEGWSSRIQVNNGEKEIHYFSWDENFRKGPLVYQQRFDGSGDRLGECKGNKVRGEVSATYLDYPKAAERAAQLLPAAKIVILLREPVSRLVSSFNMKWQVEICGKLTWTRNDCYNGITSVRVINENTVAPRQRQAAIAVWNRCNVDKKSLGTECLRQDFTKKLTDKINAEIERLKDCERQNWEDTAACLGINGLEQEKLYAMMEDSTFVWRSMYSEHLQRWLKVYPPESMLVVPSEHLKEPKTFKTVMDRFAKLIDVPSSGPSVKNELIFQSSPASTDGHVHENGRTYIAEAPPELAQKLHKVFCPKNQVLMQLMLDKKLISKVGDFPWLDTTLKRDC